MISVTDLEVFKRRLAMGLALSSIFFMAPAHAGTFSTVYQFTGGSDGSGPSSSVIEDASGNLYGEAGIGGTKDCVTSVSNPTFYGCGTLYSYSAAMGLKTLVEFNGPNGAYGDNSPLLIGSALYGSAIAGGASDKGVLFSVRTDGSGFKLLHQFNGSDGNSPTGPLVVGSGHVLYGITAGGGPAYPARTYGVLFKISATGAYSILHSFSNGSDGAYPTSISVEKSGLIVGATSGGGNTGKYCGYSGCGVLYSYDPSSAKFVVQHTFTGVPGQGYFPVLGSRAPDGTVYGNASPFFSIGPRGFTLLPSTGGGSQIGYGVNIAPTLSADGSLTSVEQEGPIESAGTLYQQLDGVITVLHTFNGPDGGGPIAAPLLTPSGSFIGITGTGGAACSCGTIYQYSP